MGKRTIFRCVTWCSLFIFTPFISSWCFEVFFLFIHIWKHLMKAVLACVLVNKISPFLACIQIAIAEIIYLTCNFSYVPLPLHPPSFFFLYIFKQKLSVIFERPLTDYCFFTYHLSFTNAKYWFPSLSVHCDNVSLKHLTVLLLSTLAHFQLRKAPYK